jgi:hypothetical protein
MSVGDLDLSDNTTPEEIQEYVDSVVKDIEESHDDKPGEKQGEEGKTLGEVFAEEDGRPAEPKQSGGDKPAEDGVQDWITDDLKAEVAAYGIGDDDLADFGSREELDRALRLFDRTALEAGRKAAEGDGGQDRDEQGRYTKKAPESEGKEEGKAKDGQYVPKLDKDVWDDDLIGELSHLHGSLSDRIAELETMLHAINAQAEEKQFDGIIDSLGHADLFGKTGKESSAELKRRKDLLSEVDIFIAGSEALGRPVELSRSLVERVARMTFADDFTKKEIKARTRKISEQSKRRQGGSAAKGSPEPQESLLDEMRRLYDELDQQ